MADRKQQAGAIASASADMTRSCMNTSKGNGTQTKLGLGDNTELQALVITCIDDYHKQAAGDTSFASNVKSRVASRKRKRAGRSSSGSGHATKGVEVKPPLATGLIRRQRLR